MSSSIPNAVQQFITIAATVMPSQSVFWFGKALPVYTQPWTLQINEITADQQPAELGPTYRREELFELHGILSSWAGDSDNISRLNEVFAMFADITVAVANNPTLNSAVRFAECSPVQYVPDVDPKGFSLGELNFEIRCSQRITSLT